MDLEIKSAAKLDKLEAEIGKRLMVLFSGTIPGAKRYFVNLETRRQHKTPDATILAFCDIIENLSPLGRRLWNAADKEFNIGLEWDGAGECAEFLVPNKILKRVVGIGANLGVTYYRGEVGKRTDSASELN